MTPSALSNETVIATLKPFAALGQYLIDQGFITKPDDAAVWGFDNNNLTYGDFRKAAALITELLSYRSEGKNERRAAWWTYDAEAERNQVGRLYYFGLADRADPPYREQRHVEAIIDIAADGTLAGVELIDNMPPPPGPLHALSPSTERGETIEGWQPIETAPKNKRVMVAWPQTPYDDVPWAYQVARISPFDLTWRSTMDSRVLPEIPTHWRYLESPPRALNPSGSVER